MGFKKSFGELVGCKIGTAVSVKAPVEPHATLLDVGDNPRFCKYHEHFIQKAWGLLCRVGKSSACIGTTRGDPLRMTKHT